MTKLNKKPQALNPYPPPPWVADQYEVRAAATDEYVATCVSENVGRLLVAARALMPDAGDWRRGLPDKPGLYWYVSESAVARQNPHEVRVVDVDSSHEGGRLVGWCHGSEDAWGNADDLECTEVLDGYFCGPLRFEGRLPHAYEK